MLIENLYDDSTIRGEFRTRDLFFLEAQVVRKLSVSGPIRLVE